MLGSETSGEAEPFLLKTDGKIWLGLASDHTDRALEAYSVAHSKQICAKPVADELWPLDEVLDHLDRLELKSWIRENGDWVPYQDGTFASILPRSDTLAVSGRRPNPCLRQPRLACGWAARSTLMRLGRTLAGSAARSSALRWAANSLSLLAASTRTRPTASR